MPFNTFGPVLTSLGDFFLTSFLSIRPFDPRGGERDGPRVRFGDLERREERLDDVERSVNVGRDDDREALEDVRPVVELRREVGTVSGLPIRICSRVRYISLLRYSRWAMSFDRDRSSLPDRDLSSRLECPDRDQSSRLGGLRLRDRDRSSRVRRLGWRWGWSS